MLKRHSIIGALGCSVLVFLCSCERSSPEFRYHLLASALTSVSENMISGILTPCDPCIELEIYTGHSYEKLKASPTPVLILRPGDIGAALVAEGRISPESEARAYAVFLDPNAEAKPRTRSFAEKYMLYALAVTTDGERGSLAMVVSPEDASLIGGWYGTKEEAESVAKALGVELRYEPGD